MKKKIAILGSTGSIGKSLLDIVDKDKKNFKIFLLTANTNYLTLFKQAKKYNVKNLIITNLNSYKLLRKLNKKNNFKIYKSFESFKKIFKKKIDYSMCSITGLDGLKPTIDIIKFTKKIAIANKESIICGWNLIRRELKKNNTKFIPVDSEHFSIWYGLKNNSDLIEKIYLTASGGPFLNLPYSKFKNIQIKEALKHPNWKMGKKITIDSATMMNKVFEIIEAKKIFNLNYKDLSILIHPDSYIHAIIKYKNGLVKLIAHKTDMTIPIKNTIYEDDYKFKTPTESLEISKLNNLNFKKINYMKFPLTKILKSLPEKTSLYETVLVSANDELVNLFLNKKITFIEINTKLKKILKQKNLSKYKNKPPKNIDEILKLAKYVRSNIISKSI